MTTNNAVNVPLSGNTGTGNFVGANTPTLITPVLGIPGSGTLTNCTGLPISTGVSGLGTGVAAALAVNTNTTTGFPIFSTGSWTPTDASGASLTFTTAVGEFTQIGNVVIANCEIVYPVTANGSAASIAGLPVACGASAQQRGGIVTFSTVAALTNVLTAAGGSSAQFFTSSGGNVTNITLSTATIFLSLIYFAT